MKGSMPKDRRNSGFRSVTAALALTLAAAAAPRPAAADQKHVVRAGQSLGIIAKQYGSSISALAAANGLNRDGVLREGQVLTVPTETAFVRVAAGQSLGQIARAHHVSVSALAAANHIHPDSTLQIGQELVLPGPASSAAVAKDAQPKAAAVITAASPQPKVPSAAMALKQAATLKVSADPEAPSPAENVQRSKPEKDAKANAGKSPWGKPKQSGVVQLFRIWSRESVSLRLVDSRGRPRQEARRQLREFLRPRDSRRRKMPNPRLLALLARVSDHFGGRPIHVVSGYRLAKGLTRKTSRHVAGEAIDFRIPGVPLTTLRDYCQSLSDVGVGYYPTTQFVHLDVRKQAARWTDWSLPGQPPVLVQPRIDSDDGNDGNDELIAPDATETTAERKPGDEPSLSDAPTG